MKVSIITATWNSALTIRDALNSAAMQTYSNIEHIIVDGASTDSTIEIVHDFPHVSRIISEPDRGIYDALNKGLALATGDVVGFLHSDDLFASQSVLEEIAKSFKQNDVDSLFGDLKYISKSNSSRVIRSWKGRPFDRDLFLRGWMPAHPTFYMKRSKYEDLGGFDLKYSISADYESMVRYLYSGKLSATYLPKTLVNMRLGGESNKSFSNIIKKSIEDIRIMNVHGIPLVRGLIGKNLSKIPQFL